MTTVLPMPLMDGWGKPKNRAADTSDGNASELYQVCPCIADPDAVYTNHASYSIYAVYAAATTEN